MNKYRTIKNPKIGQEGYKKNSIFHIPRSKTIRNPLTRSSPVGGNGGSTPVDQPVSFPSSSKEFSIGQVSLGALGQGQGVGSDGNLVAICELWKVPCEVAERPLLGAGQEHFF